VIEHNLDVIKTADWIIDLGPEGGVKGGEVLVTGMPEDVIREPRSFTGAYLKPLLSKPRLAEPVEALPSSTKARRVSPMRQREVAE
jgi:excinuclease ABC subunit A